MDDEPEPEGCAECGEIILMRLVGPDEDGAPVGADSLELESEGRH